ncbi:hypothetical protein ACLOJK_029130 [Asimina triloba]
MEGMKGISLLLLLLLAPIPASFSSAFSVLGESKAQFMIQGIEDVLGRTFDYIIVGGGAGGCSLTATLSQRHSVLLVERGGSPYGNPLIEEEKRFGFAFIQTDQFTSISQRFVSEDGVGNQRGRVLGGSTAINAGFYGRASRGYINRAGWDPELVREAYEWVESKIVFRPSLRRRPSRTRWQAVAAEGMVEEGIRPFNSFTLEHIVGTKVGGSIFDVRGRRHTAADLLGAGNPEKITVLLNATVQNIIFDDSPGDGKPPKARGIRFIRSNGNPGKFYEVYLNLPKDSSGLLSRGEVILCAGALGSPQILLLSGIGPKEHLMQFNITPLVDAREVGQSMQDNPTIRAFLNYSSHALSKNLLQLPDPPKVAGIVKGNRILMETTLSYASFNTTIRVSLAVKLAYPISRGSLRLVSVDPRQNPSVKFNYLVKEKDLDECTRMVRLLDRVARSRSVTAFLERRQSILPTSISKEMLRDFCKQRVATIYHYHGGCLVGSVVDRDYRVMGVEGLRVVDGSTFLDSPGTNPMATVMMLGR